jgi:D-glycero-alpha-D-manno-heptose 1-phosphate guanylyltransferase
VCHADSSDARGFAFSDSVSRNKGGNPAGSPADAPLRRKNHIRHDSENPQGHWLEAAELHRTNVEVHVGLLGRDSVTERAPNIARCNSEMNSANTMDPKSNISSGLSAGRDCKTALLLVGGLGTRLKSVLPSTPKPLAPLGDMTFLHLPVLQLRSQGIHRIVMCSGHLADQIEAEFGDGTKWDVAIEYSKELAPLGTAGAVRFADRFLKDDSDFLVMNGDSFLQFDVQEFIRFHQGHDGLVSMAVRRVADAARYGTVLLNEKNRVVEFREKTGIHDSGMINGGVYIFNSAIFKSIPKGPASLETEIFPKLLSQGVFGLEQHGMFIDIGTPEDYSRAQEVCRSLYQAAFPQ